MSKRISEFPLATSFLNSDFLATVQDGINYKVTGDIIKANLANDFASITDVEGIFDDFNAINKKIDDNYVDLSKKITSGDNTINRVLNDTMVSYYDFISDKIVTIESGHNEDILQLATTVQSWANIIGDKIDQASLQNLINRLTISENLLTQLSEIVYNYSGTPGSGGGGGTPGYHTQSTSTIFPLSGYYLTGVIGALATTDSLNQALAKLEGRLQVVETTGGGTPGGGGNYYLIKTNDLTAATDGNVYSAARSDVNYLSKTKPDTAQGKITFLQGWQAGPAFSEGFLGQGAALFRNGNKWKLEVDELFVRGGLTVNELVVNEIKAVGGEILVTQADMEVTSVEVADSQGIYRCYFDDQDGTIPNKFQVYDQAICQKFDGKNVKRYWRLVTAVGSNYVELSMTDFEPGSGVPEEGDKILQLGNRNNAERRSAIMISAKSADGPTITMYDNIYEYSLENKERTVLGKNSKFVGTVHVTDYTGDVYPVPVDKGAWVPGNTYYYYDRVSYEGSLWLCMAVTTTEAPSIDNQDVWLLQVSKGQSGSAGSDVGKWTRIMGDGLFFYENANFTGTPNPASLILNCETFNLANPVYKWINTADNATLGTSSTLTLAHTVLGTNRQILIRCEVTDGEDLFFDEAQVGKVANGADSYLVRLDNQTMTAPYDAEGKEPMISLLNIYSNIEVYRGTTRLAITNVRSTLTNGIATITLARQNDTTWRATWGSLTTDSARITLTITTASGEFTSELVMYKNLAGQPGTPGVDAGAVVVTGPNMFIVDPINGTTPESLLLTVSYYSIAEPSIKWYYSFVDEYDWQEIPGQTTNTLTVGPAMYGFQDEDVNELMFRATVTSGTTEVVYEDWMTIAKIRNGIDGEGSYIASLSNENHSVPADFKGGVTPTELAKATTNYMLMLGTTEMATADYTVTAVQLDATDSSTVSVVHTDKKITLATFDETQDSTVFKIEFRVAGNIVAVKDFTVSKTKGGAPANYEVQLYAYKTGNPPDRPTWTTLFGGNSAIGPGGTTWYLYVPSGTPIYMSKATFDGKTSQAILRDGYRWSLPTRLTGTNGVDGARGPQGATGPAGEDGRDGLNGLNGIQGPAMNFRGVWSNGTYYRTQYQVDVVRYPATGLYYMVRNIGSTTSVPSSSSSSDTAGTGPWVKFNSFDNIATNLLFAEEASIAGWQFSPNVIRSNANNVLLDGRTTANYPILIGPSVISVSTTYPFTATPNSNNAVFSVSSSGVLFAKEGVIGPWSFNSTRFRGNLSVSETGAVPLLALAMSTGESIQTQQVSVAFGGNTGWYQTGRSISTGNWKNVYNYMHGAPGKYYDEHTVLALISNGSSFNNALVAEGNVRICGGFTAFKTVASNSWIASGGHTNLYDTVVYSQNSTLHLPSYETIEACFGKGPDNSEYWHAFELTVHSRSSSVQTVTIRNLAASELTNNQTSIVLSTGQSCKLLYVARVWYLQYRF